MFAKLIVIAAAGVSAVQAACSYPPPLSNQLAGNSVTRPDLNNAPTIGETFQIVWDATGLGSTVTLILLRGPGDNIQYLETIVSGAPNNGAYDWTPHCGLEPDTTHYGMMLIDDATCKFQWSTQFGMLAGTTCSSSSSAPPPSSSSNAPPMSSTTAPSSKPPKPSESPCSESGMPPPGSVSWGGPWSPPSNGTKASTTTYWLPPATGVPTAAPTYKPIQANGASRLGMSIVGAAGALAAALVLL